MYEAYYFFEKNDLDSSQLFTMNTSLAPLEEWSPLYKIVLEHRTTDVFRNYFALHIANVWNSLPPLVVNFNSLFLNAPFVVFLTLYMRFNLFVLSL